MRDRFHLLATVPIFVLVMLIARPAGGQSVPAQRTAWAGPFQSPFGAVPATAADPGTIAYVRLSTHDIHLISPDGTGDRVLWAAPRPISAWAPLSLAWRPDGRELAFSSEHEETCSWFQSDVYAIRADGTGYRRITNAPACAMLAPLPKGSVTVNVANYTGSLVQAYVAGAPGIKTIPSAGTMTFDDVADLGQGVPQPVVGIYGLYRIMMSPPLADVQPSKTVPGGSLVIMEYSGVDAFGTGKVSWKADPFVDDVGGIYLNTVGHASGGTKLVPISGLYGGQVVYDIAWLPDGTGFLYAEGYVELGIFANIFEYNFTTKEITQVTSLSDNSARRLSISPDGQAIVFERAADEFDSTISLWIVNRNGTGLHELADDAARPAWGQVPPLRRRRG
jgi:hypothetical protein